MSTLISGLTSKHPLVHIFDWAILIAIFAFAGSLGLWSSIATRPFLVVSTTITTPNTTSQGSDVNPVPASPYSMGIAYPYRKDTISTASLILISIVTPLIFVVLHSILLLFMPSKGLEIRLATKWRFWRKYINTALLGLAAGISITLLVTEGLKSIVGKQRPDFMGRCGNLLAERIEQYTVVIIGNTRMVTYEVCENYWKSSSSKARLKDGWRSFPSGHASFSFAGMTYLVFYICDIALRLRGPLPHHAIRKVQQPSSSSIETPFVAVLFIIIAPILVALYVSSTRYSDLKHGGIDIFCGAIIGIAGAILGWSWYGGKLVQQLIRARDETLDFQGLDGKRESMALPGISNTPENPQSIQKNVDVDVIEVIVDRRD